MAKEDISEILKTVLDEIGVIRSESLSDLPGSEWEKAVWYTSVVQLRREYKDQLRNTPEEVYLEALIAYTPIDHLPISVRAAISLSQSDINYVGQMATKTEEEMLMINGLGPSTLKELRTLLVEEIDLTFGWNFSYITSMNHSI